MKRFLTILICISNLTGFEINNVTAQQTNSFITGRILNDKNEPIVAATIIAIHQPTQNTFSTISRSDGYFNLFNVKPGGPYTISASHMGYETIKKQNLYFDLDLASPFPFSRYLFDPDLFVAGLSFALLYFSLALFSDPLFVCPVALFSPPLYLSPCCFVCCSVIVMSL